MQVSGKRVLPHGAWRCQLTHLSRCSSSLRIRWKIIFTREVESLAARCQRTTAHDMRPSWRSCTSLHSEFYRTNKYVEEARKRHFHVGHLLATACFFAYITAPRFGLPRSMQKCYGPGHAHLRLHVWHQSRWQCTPRHLHRHHRRSRPHCRCPQVPAEAPIFSRQRLCSRKRSRDGISLPRPRSQGARWDVLILDYLEHRRAWDRGLRLGPGAPGPPLLSSSEHSGGVGPPHSSKHQHVGGSDPLPNHLPSLELHLLPCERHLSVRPWMKPCRGLAGNNPLVFAKKSLLLKLLASVPAT